MCVATYPRFAHSSVQYPGVIFVCNLENNLSDDVEMCKSDDDLFSSVNWSRLVVLFSLTNLNERSDFHELCPGEAELALLFDGLELLIRGLFD